MTRDHDCNHDRDPKPIRRRKSGNERRLEIVGVAARLFASHGFSVSTRKISEQLGITQAALYKHFSSKDELIAEVFRVLYLEDRPSDFSQILNGSSEPLVERLSLAYISFFNGISETSMKLFHRASYDGLEIVRQYSPHLDERILWPVLSNLRVEADLPTLDQRAASWEERELALMLHSTIVFLGIRKFVYRVDFKKREPVLIHQHVATWLAGALATIENY